VPETPANLHVEHLSIRLPEGTLDSPRSIARGVAEGLQGALPATGGDHRLGAAKLRVRVPPGAAGPEISAAIARAIARLITP